MKNLILCGITVLAMAAQADPARANDSEEQAKQVIQTCRKVLKEMGKKCENMKFSLEGSDRYRAVFLCNYSPVPEMEWFACTGRVTAATHAMATIDRNDNQFLVTKI